jgi:outer membrane protein TolC
MKNIIYILTFFLITTLNAQELSLEGCISKALSAHPDVKKAALQLQYSRSGVDVARSDYLPQVTLNGEYDPTKTYTMSQNGVFSTKESYGYSGGVTLNQKIWDFSKTTSAIRAQEAQEDISALSLKDAKALLAYEVKLLYELMVVQKEAIHIKQKDLSAKEELYKQAQALVKQGMKTNADASRFLSSVYVAKESLSGAYADFDKARTTLSLYIGEPIEADAQLENTLAKGALNSAKQESILESSPTLNALKKQVVKNEFSYLSARASHYGSIDAVASYMRQNSLNIYNSTFVGIMLKIPFYSGGKISALEEQALITKKSSEEEYSSKSLALKKEFQTLLIDLKRYEDTIKTKEAQREAATATQEVVEGRYKEGLSTYIEVLDAIAQTLDAKLGLLQAQYAVSGIYYRLEYLRGKTK